MSATGGTLVAVAGVLVTGVAPCTIAVFVAVAMAWGGWVGAAATGVYVGVGVEVDVGAAVNVGMGVLVGTTTGVSRGGAGVGCTTWVLAGTGVLLGGG